MDPTAARRARATGNVSWVVLALLVASAAWAAEGPNGPPTREPEVPIVPGRRIGPLTVEMTPTQMRALLGPPERIDRYPERNILSYDWKSQGYLVSFFLDTQRTRIVAVYGALQRFRTDRGIRLLMPLDRALRAYGQGGGYQRWDCTRDRITVVRYQDLGLQFAAVNEPGKPLHGLIFSIGVFRPGLLRGEAVRCVTQ